MKYLVVHKAFSFYPLYASLGGAGLAGLMERHFLPVAETTEYIAYRIAADPVEGVEGPPAEVSYSENLFAALPPGGGSEGWSFVPGPEPEAGEGVTLNFTGGEHYSLVSVEPVSHSAGETYLVELRIAATPEDEYRFALSLGGVDLPLRYEGYGHEGGTFGTLFTPGRDITAAVELTFDTFSPANFVRLDDVTLRRVSLRIETFSPNQNPLVDRLSIRPVNLLPPEKGAGN